MSPPNRSYSFNTHLTLSNLFTHNHARTIRMSSTDSDYSQWSGDSQSPVIGGKEYGSESSVSDGKREELDMQKPAGVKKIYGSKTYETKEEDYYSKPVEVDEVYDSQLSVISDGADHFSKPQIDGRTCHSDAFKLEDGSEASTAVREGIDRQSWILALLFEDLDSVSDKTFFCTKTSADHQSCQDRRRYLQDVFRTAMERVLNCT